MMFSRRCVDPPRSKYAYSKLFPCEELRKWAITCSGFVLFSKMNAITGTECLPTTLITYSPNLRAVSSVSFSMFQQMMTSIAAYGTGATFRAPNFAPNDRLRAARPPRGRAGALPPTAHACREHRHGRRRTSARTRTPRRGSAGRAPPKGFTDAPLAREHRCRGSRDGHPP